VPQEFEGRVASFEVVGTLARLFLCVFVSRLHMSSFYFFFFELRYAGWLRVAAEFESHCISCKVQRLD